MIPQVIKDTAPIFGWGTIITFIVWIWRKSLVVNEVFKDGKKAIKQIDILSSNHFPHMEAGVAELNTKTDKSNEILTECATSLAVLVDRGNR